MKQSPFILVVLLFCFHVASAQKINWLTIEEAELASKKEPKKILIDVYTDWCGWCKKLDATTFKNKEIVDQINKYYYPVKLNGEYRGTLHFKGVLFNYEDLGSGKRGYHELAAGFLQGKMSYPTVVILDEELTVLQSFNGYFTAKEFFPILQYLGEDIYKTKAWMDYFNEFNQAHD